MSIVAHRLLFLQKYQSGFPNFLAHFLDSLSKPPNFTPPFLRNGNNFGYNNILNQYTTYINER